MDRKLLKKLSQLFTFIINPAERRVWYLLL